MPTSVRILIHEHPSPYVYFSASRIADAHCHTGTGMLRQTGTCLATVIRRDLLAYGPMGYQAGAGYQLSRTVGRSWFVKGRPSALSHP